MANEERRRMVLEAAGIFGKTVSASVVDAILERWPEVPDEDLQSMVKQGALKCFMANRTELDVDLVEQGRRILVENAEYTRARAAQQGAAADDAPIFEAIADDKLAKVRKLVAAGADLRAVSYDHDGQPPLSLAIELRMSKIARCLLEHGADPNYDGEHGFSPIHLACGSLDCLGLLIEFGADVDRTAEDAMTPLMLVAGDDRHLAQVELLLARGADPSPRNKHGETALDIALKAGATSIADRLR